MIILFGHTGMLGRYVYSYFKNIRIVEGFRMTKETTFADIEKVLQDHGINESTCVINCIGAIPQREKNPMNFYVVNGLFPHLLWAVCQKYRCRMIQPTTDCVFSGNSGMYTENDHHDEIGHYGISKSLGEPGCTVIRTSIIGEELANKKSFLEFVKNSSGAIKGWTNHMWNGITCLEYCKVIEKIITENLFWSGVRHISSPTAVSKYELACMIRTTFEVTTTIVEDKGPTRCDKTLTSVYPQLFVIPEISTQITDLRKFKRLEL